MIDQVGAFTGFSVGETVDGCKLDIFLYECLFWWF